MPGPPPPPPPAGPPPPMMPAFTPPKGDLNARSALLNSIQKGSRLKKAVTNDKSAPILGKVSNLNNSSTSSNANTFETSKSGSANGVPIALGGLFAGGMPKLKSTGLRAESPSSGSNSSSSTSNQNLIPKSSTAPSSSNQKSNIQNELKKQMANDNRTRGPPPPAPVRNFNSSEPHLNRNGSTTNGLSLPAPLTGTGMGACGSPTANISSLHRNAQSNLNLSTWSDSTGDSTDGCNVTSRPTPSHGKPNLAPRPPQTNGKPAAPPKKLLNGKTTPSSVHRAQSMRNTSSRQPTTPDHSPDCGAAPAPPPKFGTVRHMPSTTGHGGLSHARSRPLLNGRPTDPPPSVPVMPLPSVMPVMPPPFGTGGNPTMLHHHRENSHQGTPPPPSRTQGSGIGGFGHVLSQLQQGNRVSGHSTQQAPNVPPPPPPHQKTYRQPPPPPTQKHPSPPSFGISAAAPPPPPRHSSMRERPGDFESRFKFHSMSEFPRPNAFKCMSKDYRGKSGSKC